MLDLVIQGGQVVTPEGVGAWDIGIQGERIAVLGAPGRLSGDAGRVLDATGKLVIPGGIDPHVHTDWPIPALGGGVTSSAPPEQVSRAAIHGGTTTLVDFGVWEPGLTLAAAVEAKEAVWRSGYTDHALHVMLQGAVPPEVIAQVPEAIQAGFPSIKIFTTNIRPVVTGRMIRLGHLWAIMTEAARHGGLLAIHAEDDDLVMYMYERLEREGRTDIAHMPLAHSAMSEDISFRRILRLARYVPGAAVYFVHVSAGAGVDAIAEARGQGLAVYGETLHHYASFTAEAYQRPDGVIYHTYPSLKHEEDRQRLWAGLENGTLATVATDELCTPRAVKVRSRHIADATGGHVGVETRLPIIYTEGVSKRGMSLERFVAVTSSNAARLLGLYPQKGAIAVGSDADLVLFDPTARRVLRSTDLHGSDYSAWDGWEVHGWPAVVLLRGQVAVDNNRLLARAGAGRRVPGKIARAIQDGPRL
ncbi:MAG: amidohydrolase family protein [Actinobacteria bacterium]|nr:amidohydrolase family protein [Actinomycetota bacterium]